MALGAVEGWTQALAWVATLLAAALAVLDPRDRPDEVLWIPRIDGPFVAFLGLAILSAGVSSDRWLSLRETVRYAHLGLLYLVVRGLVRGPRDLAVLALGVALGGALMACYGMFQTLSGTERVLWVKKVHYVGRVTGTFLNHSHFAAYLAMVASLALGIVVGGRGTMLRLALFMASVPMLAALVLSHSRGAWLAVIMALGLSMRVRWRSGSLVRDLLAIVLIGAIAGAAAVVIAPGALEGVRKRLTSIAQRDHTDPGLFGRWPLWRGTAAMAVDHPVLGTGPGTFEVAFPPYRPMGYFYKLSRTHNDLLEVWAECGTPALLALLLGLCRAMWVVARRAAVSALDGLDGAALGAFVGLMAGLIHSGLDFVFHIPANAYLFSALIGAAMGLWGEGFHRLGRVRWRPLRAPLAAAALVALVPTAVVGIADAHRSRARWLREAGRLADALAACEVAGSWLRDEPRTHKLYAEVAGALAEQALRRRDNTTALTWAVKAAREGGEGTRRMPGDAEGWVWEGRANLAIWMAARTMDPGQAGPAIARAQECFRAATGADPHHHWGYVHLGNALFYGGKTEEAMGAYEDALRRYPNDRLMVFPEIAYEMAPAAILRGSTNVATLDGRIFELGIRILALRKTYAPDDIRPYADMEGFYTARGLPERGRAEIEAFRARERLRRPDGPR